MTLTRGLFPGIRLKKKGVNEQTYQDSLGILDRGGIGRSLRQSIQEYLQQELEFAQSKQISSCISSDIIESFFGKYKYHSKIHAFSEINRMILILPCLYKAITPQLIDSAFKAVSTADVTKWIQKNVEGTLLSRRRKILDTDVLSYMRKKMGKKLREAA